MRDEARFPEYRIKRLILLRRWREGKKYNIFKILYRLYMFSHVLSCLNIV